VRIFAVKIFDDFWRLLHWTFAGGYYIIEKQNIFAAKISGRG